MRNTDVSHESIRVSLHQKTSILNNCHLQSTMFLFRRAGIHARGYGSSTDLEVKASSGRLAATYRLYKSRLVFPGGLRGHWYGNSLRCSFNSLTISCMVSTTQSDIVSAGCHQPIKAIPRAREIPVADRFPSASGDMDIQQKTKEEWDKSNSHHP